MGRLLLLELLTGNLVNHTNSMCCKQFRDFMKENTMTRVQPRSQRYIFSHTFSSMRLETDRENGQYSEQEVLLRLADAETVKIFDGSGIGGRADGFYARAINLDNNSDEFNFESIVRFFNLTPTNTPTVVFAYTGSPAPRISPASAGITALWDQGTFGSHIQIIPIVSRTSEASFTVYNSNLLVEWLKSIAFKINTEKKGVLDVATLLGRPSTHNICVDLLGIASQLFSINEKMHQTRRNSVIKCMNELSVTCNTIASLSDIPVDTRRLFSEYEKNFHYTLPSITLEKKEELARLKMLASESKPLIEENIHHHDSIQFGK